VEPFDSKEDQTVVKGGEQDEKQGPSPIWGDWDWICNRLEEKLISARGRLSTRSGKKKKKKNTVVRKGEFPTSNHESLHRGETNAKNLWKLAGLGKGLVTNPSPPLSLLKNENSQKKRGRL